jgi:hypothetical protein
VIDTPDSFRAFNPGERHFLFNPDQPEKTTKFEIARLEKLGLIEKYRGEYYVTEKGVLWREIS